jgi:hypothetical protein
MGTIGKDFNYKKIKNFLTLEEINLLKNYCEIKHRLNVSNFSGPPTVTEDTSFYGDVLTESLLLNKKKLMEKNTGKKLFPTYSFWRLYTKYATLKKHVDRPSCEISVTVNIASDKDWPIIIDGKEMFTKPGEAIIYLGEKLFHERKEFTGDYCIQTFLHYVDQNGLNKDFYCDKRNYWGIEEPFVEPNRINNLIKIKES